MNIKIGSNDNKVNGWHWKIQITSHRFYMCDHWLPEDDEHWGRHCDEEFDRRKDYKKHLSTHFDKESR